MPIRKTEPPAEKKIEYEIVDKHCREIAGNVVADGQKTVWLIGEEAAFFLANGGIIPARAADKNA